MQHREVQNHESNQFKSYFKNGIRILKGGVASGMLNIINIKHTLRYIKQHENRLSLFT